MPGQIVGGPPDKRNWTDTLAEQLRDYAKLQADKNKYKIELAVNETKAKQNWIYKYEEMERQAEIDRQKSQTLNPLQQQELEYQKSMQEEYNKQRGGNTATIEPGQEVFDIPPQAQVVPGNKGFERKMPDDKSWAMQQIRAKEKRYQETQDPRFMLTQGEENFKKRYYGAKQENDVKALSDLRKEFIGRPEVKEFITIDTQVKSMDSLLNKALTGGKQNQLALDQALITMFNKLTDPQSVVRESEYARTPENLPFMNRLTGAIEKLQKGGAGITNQDRQALVLGAKIIANERGKVFNTTLDDYSEIASQTGLDSGIATRKMDRFKEYEIPLVQNDDSKISGSQKKYIKTGTLPDGRRVGIMPDGTPEIINAK